MMERWEMEAKRIYIKHFSNKPSVLVVCGGHSTPTHQEIPVTLTSRWSDYHHICVFIV